MSAAIFSPQSVFKSLSHHVVSFLPQETIPALLEIRQAWEYPESDWLKAWLRKFPGKKADLRASNAQAQKKRTVEKEGKEEGGGRQAYQSGLHF